VYLYDDSFIIPVTNTFVIPPVELSLYSGKLSLQWKLQWKLSLSSGIVVIQWKSSTVFSLFVDINEDYCSFGFLSGVIPSNMP